MSYNFPFAAIVPIALVSDIEALGFRVTRAVADFSIDLYDEAYDEENEDPDPTFAGLFGLISSEQAANWLGYLYPSRNFTDHEIDVLRQQVIFDLQSVGDPETIFDALIAANGLLTAPPEAP